MTTTSSTSLRSGQAVPATRSTIGLFIFVVLAWSLNWVVMKLAVHDIAPLWAITMRTALAAILLFPILYLNRQLILPPRSDYPVVVSISLFHMVGFAALMTLGLTHISAGRAIVLGYTTPLWVAPAAFFFLKEKMSIRQMLGMVIGIGGLLLFVGSNASDWRSKDAIWGNVLPLLASLSWSVSIIYTRAHRWTATPLQLMPWQCLLATVVLSGLALGLEGLPPTRVSSATALALAYNGVIGTALGFWAMTVVNRRVPATTSALGVLATPILGIGIAAVVLGERIELVLILSALVIVIGLFVGRQAPH
ncbi:DMT family transporter [Herbaspirillum rubrisubalbicans]|uniref:DMT family transporter n=1 Tax=Herbaspirillum rubrisubalbicans TaxID=80842 RepID=UPI0026468724|nr:DMT family transporter [Herbaspirillum rubrisubalbicans]